MYQGNVHCNVTCDTFRRNVIFIRRLYIFSFSLSVYILITLRALVTSKTFLPRNVIFELISECRILVQILEPIVVNLHKIEDLISIEIAVSRTDSAMRFPTFLSYIWSPKKFRHI